MSDGKKPVFESRLRQIRASVFRNRDKRGREFFNTHLVRRYRSGEDEWTNSSYFTGKEDLVMLKQLIDEVLEFMNAG